MNWRILNWLILTFILATVALAAAQPAKKVARIGHLANTAATSVFNLTPFRERLRGLGYIEGQNLTIEYRYFEGKVERLPELVAAHQHEIIALAAKHRRPAIYSNSRYADLGGLMSYNGDRSEQLRRAAEFVDKILKGVKPADLPVERSKKFEFVINLQAAKQIGLTIPPNVLVRADRVIK